MKKIILPIILCCCFAFSTQAQIKAVTETGDEVILYDNGKWTYVSEPSKTETEIRTNSKKFKKSDKATFLLKSEQINLGVHLDPKTWEFYKAINNPNAEYEFQLKDKGLQAMLITEKISIPLKTLRSVVIENGRKAAPDLKVTKEEYRNVNGIDVLMMQMEGTIQGIEFAYYGYYYSNDQGIAQFLLYSTKELIEKNKTECEDFLNGFVEL